MKEEKRLNTRFDLYIIGIILLPVYFLLFRILFVNKFSAIAVNAFLLFYIIIYIISFWKFIKLNSNFSTKYIHSIRKWKHTIFILQNMSFIFLTIGLINLGLNLQNLVFSYTGTSIFLKGLLWLIPSIILLREIHTFRVAPDLDDLNSFYK